MRRRRYSPADLPAELRERIVVNPLTGCREWQHDDGPDPYRYGVVSIDGFPRQFAYRLAYTLLAGRVPAGHALDHVYALGCRAKSCCWPAHLEAVTGGENTRRARYANIQAGVSAGTLRRIGEGRMREHDRPLLDAAWMLPFDPHPGVLRPARRPCAMRQPPAAGPAPATPPPPAPPRRVSCEFLTAEELSWSWSIRETILAGWRKRGYGPPWEIRDHVVIYPCDRLDAWLDDRKEETRLQQEAKMEASSAATAA